MGTRPAEKGRGCFQGGRAGNLFPVSVTVRAPVSGSCHGCPRVLACRVGCRYCKPSVLLSCCYLPYAAVDFPYGIASFS